MGRSDHRSCRTCRRDTRQSLDGEPVTARGMTTETWRCDECGTVESRSYRAAAAPAGRKWPARLP